jgi:hypothetical protein
VSATYAKAAREALPHAQLIVDRFHLVKRANEMLDTVRRRTTAAHQLRRGRKCDPEWINRRRLLRAAERLTDEQRSRLFEQLTSADPNGTSPPPGSPKSHYEMCWAAPPVADCATKSLPPSTPPSTVGPHRPITASAIQHQTAAPLLTRMSRPGGFRSS